MEDTSSSSVGMNVIPNARSVVHFVRKTRMPDRFVRLLGMRVGEATSTGRGHVRSVSAG